MRHLIAAAIAIGLLASGWFGVFFPDESGAVATAIEHAGKYVALEISQVASVVLSRNPKSVEYLQEKYENATKAESPWREPTKKVRILIAPGHEPGYGGAEYLDVDERDLVVLISNHLAKFLAGNPRYEVFTTRNHDEWSDEMAEYFETQWDTIKAWRRANKDDVKRLSSVGAFKPASPNVIHIDVEEDVALRLYGINKWANENDIDIVLHLHLNDYPGRYAYGPGEYSGFALYVPESQYLNSTTTKALADTIFERLRMYNEPSNFPGEKGGIVEDQDLIAVGSFNSVDGASMLIEYGYIYEPQFANHGIRALALKDLAYQTYLGLQDFFEAGTASSTTVLPYRWTEEIKDRGAVHADVFALQSVLAHEGMYPPQGMKKSECPRTGKLGMCTREALAVFQEKYGITGEEGRIGKRTIEVLNEKYGVK